MCNVSGVTFSFHGKACFSSVLGQILISPWRRSLAGGGKVLRCKAVGIRPVGGEDTGEQAGMSPDRVAESAGFFVTFQTVNIRLCFSTQMLRVSDSTRN